MSHLDKFNDGYKMGVDSAAPDGDKTIVAYIIPKCKICNGYGLISNMMGHQVLYPHDEEILIECDCCGGTGKSGEEVKESNLDIQKLPTKIRDW